MVKHMCHLGDIHFNAGIFRLCILRDLRDHVRICRCPLRILEQTDRSVIIVGHRQRVRLGDQLFFGRCVVGSILCLVFLLVLAVGC